MNLRSSIRFFLLPALILLFAGFQPASADSSHVRIVRLSLLQGDVRFARDVHGDPLADQKVNWETGVLNLPIRQSYVIATDNGRAEVEFENGAMAFLNENTILEFFDLSLEDGSYTTRLILRQGTASFTVNPARGDYFSVTGGDFTAEAVGRATFRVNNYDDGSTVNVTKGHISVVHQKDSTPLNKGQALSMKAGENSITIDRAPQTDDFDQWVSSRIDTSSTATNASMQYVTSPYYTSGFGDLYTYGSWFPVSGYGYGWRPYGVGFGWSPFDSGGWFFDSAFGWSFYGSAPWGWLPYHYGGWIFEPGFGWTWIPGGFGYGGFGIWNPSNGIWVRSHKGNIGVVPVHPLDSRGKTPINIARGVIPVQGGTLRSVVSTSPDEKWKVVKNAPRETLNSTLPVSTPPTRVSRTIVSGNSGVRGTSLSNGPAISFDSGNHRFVNNTSAQIKSDARRNSTVNAVESTPTRNSIAISRAPVTPATTRTNMPPRNMTPPAVPRSTTIMRSSSGGSSGSGGQPSFSGASSSRSSSAPSSAPRASSGSSSGGRPH